MIQTRQVPLGTLVEYAGNAKIHDEANIEAIRASIRRFGNCDPIGVWTNEQGELEIVEGHGRKLALEAEGYEYADVIMLDHLTDEERRAYTLAHNQTTLMTDFDLDALELELDALAEFDMEGFGFDLGGDNEWFDRTVKDGRAREEDNDEYNDFLEKFEVKKTTDDCYTPELVYEAVAQWVADEYGVDRSKFVRPFYPGGDYQAERYSSGCVVVDNPPFSILSEIVRFYDERGVRFFLFAPTLTLFGSGRDCDLCYVATNAAVTYENGAIVDTSFVTNLESENIIRTAPALHSTIAAAVEKEAGEKASAKLIKHKYPSYVVTSATVANWSKYGVEFRVRKGSAARLSALDAQKEYDKTIFGTGFLLSEAAKADAEAAKADAEAARALEAAMALGEGVEIDETGAVIWPLSDRELEIVKALK